MAIQKTTTEVPDETYTHKNQNKKMEVYKDQNPIDPRTHSQLATMTCSHGTYDLGDTTPDTDKHSGWASIKSEIQEKHDVKAILPIYLYDHSMITISTTKFNGPHAHWDSGQIGFIYITQEDLENREIKEEYRTYEKFVKWLKQEVEEYDNYLTGNVWRYQFYEDEELTDSCGGFHGHDRNPMFGYIAEDMEDYKKEGSQ